jgi:hypothetical protein
MRYLEQVCEQWALQFAAENKTQSSTTTTDIPFKLVLFGSFR